MIFEENAMNYLFAHWASYSHSAAIVSTRARVTLRHFLSIFPPLATITDLKKPHYSTLY